MGEGSFGERKADRTLARQKYPNSRINSLSNSATQKVFIDEQAAKRGLKNVTVYTGDVNVYEFSEDKR